MAAVEPNFMECPLVIWVDTFRPQGSPKLKYSDLYNGVFLCDVMQRIDSRPAYQNVVRTVRDVNIRLQNWDILIKNIRAYYADVLQQLLIVKSPNIQLISREPEKDVSFKELKKVLLLVLGCAVQCEQKEDFIKVIMALEVGVQQEIVESIKQITDDTQSILSTECQDSDKLFNHLVRLIKERDDDTEMMSELAQERDYYQSQAEGKTPTLAPTTSPEKQHLVLELTDCKAKIRKLKQELDEKLELYSDLCDESEEYKASVTKLRNENVELLKDARSARALRDELDILREKVGRGSAYEAEILKYKEKLNEMEFYKARVEELREDNAILIENKGMLEEQLSSSHKRIETVVQLEQELVKYRKQIEEMAQERDDDREKIRVLAEENAQLQFHKKVSMNESATLEQEIEATKARIAGVGGAISDQLKETTNAKILRLELENQHLMRKIEDMRESSLIENTTLNLQLEKENQRLAKKIENLQHTVKENSQKCFELEEHNRELSREKANFVQSLELTKESAERQVRELEQQNDDLNQTLEVVRTRSEQTNDTKLKDLERENKRLHQNLSVKNQQLSKIEFENRQLVKSNSRTREISNKINELENDKDNLERDNMELRHTIEAQKLTCEKSEQLETKYSDLEVDNEKLNRKIQTLQTTIQKKEKLEQEHINLTVENQKLQRMIENMKHSSSKMAELDNENNLLKKELQQQQKIVESKKNQSVKLEKMELDLMDLDNENMKLQRQLEITSNRVQQLETDNTDLEVESEKLQEKLESSKYSQKRLAELEKQNSNMEQECLKLQKENSQLTKENKRSKVTLEARESAINDLTTKYSMMDMSYKELKRKMETQSIVDNRETEREHKELLQNLQMEKQMVASLRNDLLNEKIRTQELTNELEKLHQDLEILGVKKDKLADISEASDDESRFKALEAMMEEGLNKSLVIKEDKIAALESRLEESKNRNLKLQEDLRLTRRECESLKQRYEEEALGKEKERQETRHVRNSPFMKQQSEDQTGYLVKLERNNATLMVENDNLKSQMNDFNEKVKKLETQNSQLQSQNSTMHGQTGTLQSQNAKLQVENATLVAQCSSLQAQNSTLQNQMSDFESENRRLTQMCRDLQGTHDHLVQDHETLQRIHAQSENEYESLISEHGSLKSIHKTVKNENRDLQQQINSLIHGKDDENKIREFLMREREQLQQEKKSLGSLQVNYNKLREEHDRLRNEYEKLKNNHSAMEKENRDVLFENKKLKSEYNLMQQDNSDNREKYRVLDTNFNFLADKFDALYETHQKTLEDKEQLMNQVELLIGKNQELLNHVLGSKDQMAGQEKLYLEQMADLRRQKERLEEKIMDHYKNRDKQKKNKSFSAMLLQKVRGLKRSKSRPNLTEVSPDNSSLGSGSFAEPDGEFSKKSGMGRPTSDDEGGFRSSAQETPDFLTLEEFLAEGVDKSSPRMKRRTDIRHEDTESRSSENSDGSARRRKPAPQPPINNNRNSRIGSIPDVAAVSQSHSDLSMSRMSRVSTGSSGSSQDVRAELTFQQVSSPAYNMQPNNTSTPAKNNGLFRQKYDDLNSSAFSRVHREDDHFDHLSSPQTPHYKTDNTDGYSPQFTSTREPTPERDNRLTPDARLDILTRGNALSPNSSQGGVSPVSNYSSPKDPRSRSQDDDMSVKSGQGYSPQQGWVRNQHGPSPGAGQQRPMKATNPQYPRSHSPARLSHQGLDERNTASPSTPQKKGNILVSRANIGPRPFEKNTVRARPASAFGAPLNNSYQKDYSPNSHMNNARSSRQDLNNSISNQSSVDVRTSYDDSYYNGAQSPQTNGPVQNSSVSKRSLPNRVERPKSVPPTMFNVQGGSDSDSNYNNSENGPTNHRGNKGTPPVPPPRKTRDILTTGRYSVLREPNSPSKPMPNNKAPLLNNAQVSSSQTPPRSQSSSAGAPRIGPPIKANHGKPPAPKPMRPEEGDVKENSICWSVGLAATRL